MAQSLILLKTLPDPDYLHNLQAEGVYRASMNFLPGGCYAGAALYDASPMYAMSGSVAAADSCPTPDDPAQCKLWEIQEIIKKLSHQMPELYNAYLFVKVRAGSRAAWAGVVREVAAAAEDSAYVAAGHLQGCGPYNAVVEIAAGDHDLLLDLQVRVTDVEGVEEFSVGRVRADDTRGWGETAD